jgi:hypothetical protein
MKNGLFQLERVEENIRHWVQRNVLFQFMMDWELISAESLVFLQNEVIRLIDNDLKVSFLADFTTSNQFFFERYCADYPKNNYLPLRLSLCRTWFAQHPEQGALMYFLTVRLLNSLKS